MARDPRVMLSTLRRWLSRIKRAFVLVLEHERGQRYSRWYKQANPTAADKPVQACDLLRYFDEHKSGPGVWKWLHYFDIYERHLGKFRGKRPVVMEIGVYSGGSLEMWRQYFGEDASLIGVDIEPACRAYEKPGTRILIGDQADRMFWRETGPSLPPIDVVIDDGGHLSHQQIISLQELLPFMSPGGVYICEDVHGLRTDFAGFVSGLADSLNQVEGRSESHSDPEQRIKVPASRFQSAVRSVTWYPFMMVAEMNEMPIGELRAPKRGTQWEPFLS